MRTDKGRARCPQHHRELAQARAAGYRNLLINPETWSRVERFQIERQAQYWERRAQ